MILYRARVTGKYEKDLSEDVIFAPIIESAALDEYDGSWSVIVNPGNEGHIFFSFLAADAPRVLKEGDIFILRVGRLITAEGVVDKIMEKSNY